MSYKVKYKFLFLKKPSLHLIFIYFLPIYCALESLKFF